MKVLVLLLAAVSGLCAGDVTKISLTPTKTMSRADLYVWSDTARPKCVLVLVPGFNGNGEGLVRQAAWQEFARANKMGLVGVSFGSLVGLEDEKGYYMAAAGSGDLLMEGIKKAFKKDLPILLYGFSAGGHFTSRFVEWKPERVLTWCAYASGWWELPKPHSVSPPGLVGCGEEDYGSYGASLIYFKQGRASGKPWLWVSLPKTGHHTHAGFEQFVRNYFQTILKAKEGLNPDKQGIWVDIDRFNQVTPDQEHPALTAWIPDARLFPQWKGIHQP